MNMKAQKTGKQAEPSGVLRAVPAAAERQRKKPAADKPAGADQQAIAMAAYLAWERDGKPQGCDMKYWSEAEEQLRATGRAA